MKLLVTGGAGFIGTNFIKYWLSEYKNDKIVSIDSLTYAANKDEYFKTAKENDRFTAFVGDICSPVIEKFVDECDCIVHMAAHSHVDNSIADSSPFIQTNIVGTHNLLEMARKYNKRFHHISTDEVFGSLELDEQRSFDENSKYDPHSPYSASKAASDHLVRAYHTTYGLPITISNCGNNYGPWQHKEKLLPTVILNAHNDKKIPVYGDGKNERSWIFVKDHCIAIDNILKNGKIGETYVVGDDFTLSNLEIIKIILTLMKKDDSLISFVKDRLGHDRKYAIDAYKLKTELNWKATYDIEKGLQETIDWYIKTYE